MLELHVCNADGAMLKAYALGEKEEVLIGREDGCDIQISSRTISREHCAIERTDDGLVLKDLDSSSGTFVDGDRIESIPLSSGMEARVGPAILRFYEASL
jgi:pSer/pThr/pTyr-binding forkhead associated (FHA) protein